MTRNSKLIPLFFVWIALVFLFSSQSVPASHAGTDSAIFLPLLRTVEPSRILAFSMTPDRIMPDDATTTLTWVTTFDHVSIFGVDYRGGLLNQRLTPDKPSGTHTLEVDTRLLNVFSGFHLYAYNDPIVESEPALSAFANISIACHPDAWFLTQAVPTSCPRELPNEMQMAYQPFEDGMMIWRSDRDRITVLESQSVQPTWTSLQNGWMEGMPEDSNPTLQPPSDRFKPLRGFGNAWSRDFDDSGQDIRSFLGWATAPEVGYAGYFQCDATFYSSCYFNTPDGTIYRLSVFGETWEVHTSP